MGERVAVEVAEKAREIWLEVLGAPSATAEQTFLDLGGESIAAVRIAARVEDELDVQIDIVALFDDPTLTVFVDHVLDRFRSSTGV